MKLTKHTVVGLLALLALLAQGVAAEDENFNWAFDGEGDAKQAEATDAAKPAAAVAEKAGEGEGEGFEWTWEGEKGESPAAEAPTPETAAEPTADSVMRVESEAYNDLLKENLGLRDQVDDLKAAGERTRKDNVKLGREVTDLETRIGTFAKELQELKAQKADAAKDLDKVVEVESQVASLEGEKARLAEEVRQLKDTVAKLEADRKLAAVAPVAAPAATAVKPGSDLFRQVQKENAELRQKVARLESERQAAVMAREEMAVRDKTSSAVAGMASDEKRHLEAKLREAETRNHEQQRQILELQSQVPALQREVADLRSSGQKLESELEEKGQALEMLGVELERREYRLTKAERMAEMLDKAREEARQISDREKRDMHYNMAAVYARDGRYRDAVNEYLKALRVDPSDAEAHYNLGILFDDELHDRRRAAMHYRAYLKLRPSAGDGDEVRAWLVELDVDQ